MNTHIETVASVMVLVALITFVVGLRHFKILKKEDGALFSKIVLNITLPAVIFYSLSHSANIELDYLFLALSLLLVEVIILIIAWFIGKALKLTAPQLGSFLLASAFGSSALLGYSMISQIYPNNISAMSEAVVVSEIGVGIGIFTIGTMVAIYFGRGVEEKNVKISEIFITFLKSPIFISIGLGILYSSFNMPTSTLFFKEFFDVIHLISNSNTFFVALTVGVLLQFSSIKEIALIAIIAVLLKLIISPLLMIAPLQLFQLQNWQQQVVIIETAMPSAMLSVVLASKYGCDSELASKLVFITTILSAITIPIVLTFT
ncbi:MAG: hypothetical protein GQ570_04265 [Helicobacteraceae bacterium]|nr:hypothetical protein [Helicobacteraceae bacterium]